MIRSGNILLTAMMLAAALTVTIASAYYTDMITESSVLLKTADIGFGDEDGRIMADISGFDDRLKPLSEGESFEISFSTAYSGDVDAYAVTRLVIAAEGFSDGDIIRVTDGENEIYMHEADGTIYSKPMQVKKGDEIIKKYRITIVKKNGTEPISFKYDFTLAAMQKKENEELYEKYEDDGKGLYEAIEKGSSVNGFSDVTKKEDVTDGDEGVSDKKYYKLSVNPEITEGYGDITAYRWHVSDDETVGTDKSITLMLNKRNVGTGLKLWLEAENEAGYVTSDKYLISIENDRLTVRSEG